MELLEEDADWLSTALADVSWGRAEAAAWRCIDATHAADCAACSPPPGSAELAAFALVGEGRSKGAGEKRLRSCVSATPEWHSPGARAALALAAEAAALGTGAEDTVATSGMLTLLPGAVNSVPRDAHMTFDVRDIDGGRRDAVVATILAKAEEIAARRGVTLRTAVLNSDPPATSAPAVVAAIEAATAALQLPAQRMVSRAYHDTLFIAQEFPSAMIFIPCVGGFSHRPDEFASDDDMRNGVAVLALAMARLSLQ